MFDNSKKNQKCVSASTPSAIGSGQSSPAPSPSIQQYMNMNSLSINYAHPK